jgi:uncharacterized protein YbjQ (UPF0145 family)
MSLADLALRAIGKDDPSGVVAGLRVPAAGFEAGQLALLDRAGWEVCGLVSGAAVHHIPRSSWSSGTAEVEALSKAMYTARDKAFAGLRTAATAREAEGVIDISLDMRFGHGADHLPRCLAVGTAIRRRERAKSVVAGSDGPFLAWLTPAELMLLGQARYQPVGAVIGVCVYSVDRVGFAQWAALQKVNTEMVAYTEALYEARELAMTRLQDEARRYGAAGVVGVTTTERTHAWGSHVIEFFATGTAVRTADTVAGPLDPLLVVSLSDQVAGTSSRPGSDRSGGGHRGPPRIPVEG